MAQTGNHKGLTFGIFLAPFHRVGENPTLSMARDMELIEWLDELGYDEAWIGEHHSAGWEIIPSPEIFMAVAATRTKRIMLGSGVVSIPYHHPFNVANRFALLDHLTHGRCAQRLALRQQPAAGVHRTTAAQLDGAGAQQLRLPARCAQTELFVGEQLAGGVGVLALDHVEVVGTEPGDRIRVGRSVRYGAGD